MPAKRTCTPHFLHGDLDNHRPKKQHASISLQKHHRCRAKRTKNCQPREQQDPDEMLCRILCISKLPQVWHNLLKKLFLNLVPSRKEHLLLFSYTEIWARNEAERPYVSSKAPWIHFTERTTAKTALPEKKRCSDDMRRSSGSSLKQIDLDLYQADQKMSPWAMTHHTISLEPGITSTPLPWEWLPQWYAHEVLFFLRRKTSWTTPAVSASATAIR